MQGSHWQHSTQPCNWICSQNSYVQTKENVITANLFTTEVKKVNRIIRATASRRFWSRSDSSKVNLKRILKRFSKEKTHQTKTISSVKAISFQSINNTAFLANTRALKKGSKVKRSAMVADNSQQHKRPSDLTCDQR